MIINDFLKKNKNNNISKHFSFDEFIEFFKKWKYSWEDITMLEYSNNYYIAQFHKLSKSTIIISNEENSITEEQKKIIQSITNNNIIKPWKKDINFFNFFINEIIIRWKSFIFFIIFFIVLSFIVKSWLLELSKKIIEIFISILWVYFSLMIIFLTWASFNYSQELYINWKLWYYWNTDKNLAKLTFYTILYLIFNYIFIYLFWNKWFYFYWLRTFWFTLIWFWFYLTYLNFINLIDFYIDKISYLKMSEYKNKFFENNYNIKNR